MSIKQLQYFLKNYNIKHVFGYSGGANLPILNNIKKSKQYGWDTIYKRYMKEYKELTH